MRCDRALKCGNCHEKRRRNRVRGVSGLGARVEVWDGNDEEEEEDGEGVIDSEKDVDVDVGVDSNSDSAKGR
jgi:hypothetical protein